MDDLARLMLEAPNGMPDAGRSMADARWSMVDDRCLMDECGFQQHEADIAELPSGNVIHAFGFAQHAANASKEKSSSAIMKATNGETKASITLSKLGNAIVKAGNAKPNTENMILKAKLALPTSKTGPFPSSNPRMKSEPAVFNPETAVNAKALRRKDAKKKQGAFRFGSPSASPAG